MWDHFLRERSVVLRIHVAVYSAGLWFPSDEWGPHVLYSSLQSSMMTRASVGSPSLLTFAHSSRRWPLNDLIHGFSQGEPGSM